MRGRVARVSGFSFTKNSYLKKIGGCGGRGARGRGCVRWLMEGQMKRPKPVCPFNFFEVGGITMHKCTSYYPDKLNF